MLPGLGFGIDQTGQSLEELLAGLQQVGDPGSLRGAIQGASPFSPKKAGSGLEGLMGGGSAGFGADAGAPAPSPPPSTLSDADFNPNASALGAAGGGAFSALGQQRGWVPPDQMDGGSFGGIKPLGVVAPPSIAAKAGVPAWSPGQPLPQSSSPALQSPIQATQPLTYDERSFLTDGPIPHHATLSDGRAFSAADIANLKSQGPGTDPESLARRAMAMRDSTFFANQGGRGNQEAAAMGGDLAKNFLGFTQDQLGNQNKLDVMKEHSRGAIEEAKVKGGIEKGLTMNKATMDLMGAINSGKLSPEEAKSYMEAIRSMEGGGRPAPPGASPPSSVGGGPPAATGGLPGAAPAAAPLDPIAKAGQMQAQKAMIENLLGSLGKPSPQGFTSTLGGTNFDDFFSRMKTANLGPDQQAALVAAMKSGRYGDPQAVLNALSTQTARAYLPIQPPLTPDGKPVDFRLGRTRPDQMPGSYTINGDNGKPLFSLGQAAPGVGEAIGMAGGVPQAANLPYNRMTLGNGNVVPISPSDLYQQLNQPVPPGVLTDRAGLGSNLLKLWLGQ